MGLKERRAAALKAAQDIIDAAKADGDRDLTSEEVSQVEAKHAEVKHLDEQIEAATKSAAVVDQIAALDGGKADEQGGSESAAADLGDHFVKAAGEQLMAAKANGGRFSVSAPEFKANTTTQSLVSALQPAVTQVDTSVVEGFRRRLTIADLLNQGTLTGNAITYFVEGALEGDYTTVAEGAAKPQVHYADPTAVTESLKKIAAFLKESDEMVEDLPFLANAIRTRLLYNLGLFEENQLLSGDGTGQNLTGLLNRSGIQTLGAGTDPISGNADQVFKAANLVQTGTGLMADGVVIHPTDYQTFRLKKDANNQYYGGGFFTGQYGVGGVMEQPGLWGMRTVVTPAIAAGTVLVGAFQQAATVYRKGGVRVEATNSDQDDFIKNKVTIRAEERVALAVRVPAALVKLTLGTA